MPIKKCTTSDGKSGYKYGDSGKCYKNRSDAIKQMRAIKMNEGKAAYEKALLEDDEITIEDIATLTELTISTQTRLILGKKDNKISQTE